MTTSIDILTEEYKSIKDRLRYNVGRKERILKELEEINSLILQDTEKTTKLSSDIIALRNVE